MSLQPLALIMLIALVSACSAVQQTYRIPATDLSWVRLGMARSDIEAILGEPEESWQLLDQSVQTIQTFSRRYQPPARDNPLTWPVAAVGWELLNLLSLGTQSSWDRKCQRAKLPLTYDLSMRLIAAKQDLADLASI